MKYEVCRLRDLWIERSVDRQRNGKSNYYRAPASSMAGPNYKIISQFRENISLFRDGFLVVTRKNYINDIMSRYYEKIMS